MLDSLVMQLGFLGDAVFIFGAWLVLLSILIPLIMWWGFSRVADEVRKQGEMTRRHMEAATENLGELLTGKDAEKDEDHQEPRRTRDRQH